MVNDVKEYDVEVFPNFFNTGIKDFRTKEIINLEVSSQKDDREEIYKFFSKYNGYLISFNGIHYDNVIISYVIKDWKKLKSLNVNEFCEKVKAFSDKVVNDERYFDDIKYYKWYKHSFKSIDLFLYWSKMLRISKKISLKSLAVQLEYPVIQELPYHPDTVLDDEQIKIVRNYNNIHDLGILDSLAERMRGDIKLRTNIQKDYNLPCMSWDAIKITSEALLQNYVEKTYDNSEPIEEYTKRIRNQRYTSNIKDIKSILDEFDPQFELPVFQNLFNEILQSDRTFSKELALIQGNTSIKLSYGIGGLHSLNENEIYESDKEYIIVTSDVASLYPTLILKYNCIRYPEVMERYAEIKVERLIAKKNKEKIKDTFYKLILNGLSGVLDQEVSWLYYPQGALKLRVIGQMILTKLIEKCILNNWQVISTNTDGIEIRIKKTEYENYLREVKKVEEQFEIVFEHDTYKKIVYKSVSAYIAQTISGKIKKKGFFKYKDEIPLGDSVNELVVAKALENYFIKNIAIESTIKNPEEHNLHIYDYCCSKKVNKGYEIFYNNEKQQNLNRYYFSTPAPLLFKRKKGKNTMEHLHVGDPVILFNTYKEKQWQDYNINYNHYVAKTRKIIEEIEINKRQLTLF